MEPCAAGRVGHLVVVLDEVDEGRRRKAVRSLAARLALPGVSLSLKEIAVFGGRALAVEVQSLAPLVVVSRGEVVLRVLAKDTAVRPEVVVDDVQDDGEVQRVSPVDERTKIIGGAVQPRGGVGKHAVVAPPKT